MFANTKTLALIAACAIAVQAQTTTPSATGTAPASQSSLPAGLDACILSCISQAATQSSCGSFTNLPCVCTSTNFQNAALDCLQANCTSSDVAAATQLQAEECAAYLSSGGSSASMTMTGSMSMSMPVSGSSTSSPSPTTSTSAGMSSIALSFDTLVGTLIASAGVLLGGVFVL